MCRRMFAGLLVLLLSSCGHHKTEYLIQAAHGQLTLSTQGRPVEAVAFDKSMPAYVRELMAEVPHIRRFAQTMGLNVSGNYTQYVHLYRRAVVWFVGAAPEFSVTPLTWNFPIVGSFPGLGYFEYHEALQWRRHLKNKGYDVAIRPVPAFSTGGWFSDPVVSTMLRQGKNRFGALVNVLIHESVHATVLVPSQSFFNESVASFIGDRMAADYLINRFGPESELTKIYTNREKRYSKNVNRMNETYEALKKLYASNIPKSQMRQRKAQLLLKLERDMNLWYVPNNATLSGNKTYQSGKKGFEELFDTCGRDWKRFIYAIKRLKGSDFPKKQTQNISPVMVALGKQECS